MFNNYAYVTLLFPDKLGNCSYLDGAILMALGLRKQKVKVKIICLVTPDVKQSDIDILEILYDEIIVINYITPHTTIDKNYIPICKDIFDKETYSNNEKYRSICHVFTKLHIFDKNKLPYDKIVFVDTDIIPIQKYDELFKLDTPAGWLEQILELNQNIKSGYYTRVWGRWKNVSHNSLIPQFLTDIYKIPGSCINAGLLVVEPDVKIFNYFIDELNKPKNEWFGSKYKHKGCIDICGKFNKEYPFPEQCYLTQHFSGQWKMIDGAYASWGTNNELKENEQYGVHMAGLKYLIDGKMIEYKPWMMQIPESDGFNAITNITLLWGLNEYPVLTKYLFKNLKIRIKKNVIDFNLIKNNDDNYQQLNKLQQKIHDILINK